MSHDVIDQPTGALSMKHKLVKKIHKRHQWWTSVVVAMTWLFPSRFQLCNEEGPSTFHCKGVNNGYNSFLHEDLWSPDWIISAIDKFLFWSKNLIPKQHYHDIPLQFCPFIMIWSWYSYLHIPFINFKSWKVDRIFVCSTNNLENELDFYNETVRVVGIFEEEWSITIVSILTVDTCRPLFAA